MGTKAKYLPAIDGLRAIAVLAVVAYHTGMPVLGGFVGVDVFFVISGYLITRLLHEELGTTGRIDFVAFYSRRARRILPALAVVVVTTLALAPALLPPLEAKQAGEAGAAAFVFAANVYFALSPSGYFDGDIQSNPLLHLWSLGVEEQFYLAWPLVLLLVRSRPALALWVLAGLSFATAEWLLASGRGQDAFFQTPARAWELAVGGLIAVTRPHLPRGTGYAGLALVAAACAFGFERFPGIGALPAVLGAAMVIAAAEAGHRIRPLEVRPMVWVGLASYSLYLWHWPVLVFGETMPLWSKLALSGLLAAGSYRFVEQPFRQRWRLLPSQTVMASVVLIAAGTFGGLAFANHFRSIENYGEDLFRAVAGAQFKLGKDCDGWYHTDALNPCVYGSETAGRTAVLVGDSVAMQWFGAAHAIFDQAGWRLVVLTKSACPMVDAPIFYERLGRTYTECATWRSRFLDWVDKEKPDMVIVGSSNRYALTHEQWRTGTRAVLRRLAASSDRVVLLRATPVLSPSGQNSYDDVHHWQSAAAAGLANVTIVDMNSFICPAGTCRRQVDGITTYRDRVHLTPMFVESLAPALRISLGMDRAPND